MKYYAGIGSRTTPLPIIKLMDDAALFLGHKGWVLRSGGAEGADSAFERGAKKFEKEIYLPWEYFNNNTSDLFAKNLPNLFKAREIASNYHPSWDRLSGVVKNLMARNCYQILGKTLDTPVDLVICYCKVKNGEWQGGTGQALRHASDLNIPIINLFLDESRLKLEKKIYG